VYNQKIHNPHHPKMSEPKEKTISKTKDKLPPKPVTLLARGNGCAIFLDEFNIFAEGRKVAAYLKSPADPDGKRWRLSKYKLVNLASSLSNCPPVYIRIFGYAPATTSKLQQTYTDELSVKKRSHCVGVSVCFYLML
jgi:hypothetical protein